GPAPPLRTPPRAPRAMQHARAMSTTTTSPSPTTRLYYDDPLLLSFESRVASHVSFGGRRSLVLEQSAFYPEAGGQLGDRGTLGGLTVLDVQCDDAGVIHHIVDDG